MENSGLYDHAVLERAEWPAGTEYFRVTGIKLQLHNVYIGRAGWVPFFLGLNGRSAVPYF